MTLRTGLDHEWGVHLYGELLEIGGGKERMTKYFKVRGCVAAWGSCLFVFVSMPAWLRCAWHPKGGERPGKDHA